MRKLNVTGMLAIGNGEPCPFCKDDEDKFINEADKDFFKHCAEHHPVELNKALFSEPKPMPWKDKAFVLLIAQVAALLKRIEEINSLSDEDYDITAENIYGLLKDYFKSEGLINEGN